MSSNIHEISSIILAGDYPKLGQQEISAINDWLKHKFGAGFQCQSIKEASRLIKTISAWSRQHQREIQIYIDSDIWQGHKLEWIDFQSQVLAKDFGRVPRRKSAKAIKKKCWAIC